MASEVKSITSESLEAAYRALTPSQSGFTQDLMASNTIIPVLDLTASASGSTTGQNLQTALAFGSQTGFKVTNTTTAIASSPGFYRVFGVLTSSTGASNTGGGFTMTDGLSTKQIWAHIDAGHATLGVSGFDFVAFLAAGITLNAFADSANIVVTGSTRQIADVNGTLVNPSGFTPQ